jgi:hypothetical protein
VQVGDRWQRVEIVDEKVTEEFEPWEGGGGGEYFKQQTFVLHCDCGKDFEVAKGDLRKRKHKDCGCGLAALDGRKASVGPYTVTQSTASAIAEYARLKTAGNASYAVTLMVREVMKNMRRDEAVSEAVEEVGVEMVEEANVESTEVSNAER